MPPLSFLKKLKINIQKVLTYYGNSCNIIDVRQSHNNKEELQVFTPFKERTLSKGQRVRVYRNLHNGRWSIADATTGLVLGYADNVELENVEYKIQKGGQAKVRANGVKQVHAFVVGDFVGHQAQDEDKALYYNPYKTDTFVTLDDMKPIHESPTVHMAHGRLYA